MRRRLNPRGLTFFLSDNRDGTSTVSFNGKRITVALPIEDLDRAWFRWTQGMFVQDAFPTLAPSEREFFMTGLTPAEWTALFGA